MSKGFSETCTKVSSIGSPRAIDASLRTPTIVLFFRRSHLLRCGPASRNRRRKEPEDRDAHRWRISQRSFTLSYWLLNRNWRFMDGRISGRCILTAAEAISGGELFVSFAGFWTARIKCSFLLLKSAMEKISAILSIHVRQRAASSWIRITYCYARDLKSRIARLWQELRQPGASQASRLSSFLVARCWLLQF